MNNERPRRNWAWPPLVPRPILAVAWAGFNGITALAIVIDLIQAPAGMPAWSVIWEAIGGDASGVCYWALLGSYLYSEVITMILTKWANQARVEQAREEALEQGRSEGRTEGRTEGRAEGRQRGRTEENRRWREYLERRTAAERAGLPFYEPMPEPPDPFLDDH